MQCVPDVADASMYRNCRLRIVRGQEMCRCAVLPQALRRATPGIDRDVVSTGSTGAAHPRGVGFGLAPTAAVPNPSCSGGELRINPLTGAAICVPGRRDDGGRHELRPPVRGREPIAIDDAQARMIRRRP